MKVHFLDVSLPELKQRISRRNAPGNFNSPRVDPADLDAWAMIFEPPDADELR